MRTTTFLTANLNGWNVEDENVVSIASQVVLRVLQAHLVALV